jgi:hypothetical protein
MLLIILIILLLVGVPGGWHLYGPHGGLGIGGIILIILIILAVTGRL